VLLLVAWILLFGGRETVQDIVASFSLPQSGASPGPDPETLQIQGMTAEPQPSNPKGNVMFTIRTSMNVDRLRLQDADNNVIAEAPDEPLGLMVYRDDPNSQLVWMLPVDLADGYDGEVSAYAGASDGDGGLVWAEAAPALLAVRNESAPTAEPAPSAEPTPTPEPTPSPTPSPTPTPEPTPEPTPSPTPTPYAASKANPSESALPATIKLTNTVVVNKVEDKKFEATGPAPQLGDPTKYAVSRLGVTTFRGGPFRQNAAYSTAEVEDKKLDIIWSARTGANKEWYGIAWTGQPLLVRWPQEAREMMNITAERKAKTDLVECIYPTRDGKIYFIDAVDGVATRDPIDAGMAFEGTPAIDPRGVPLLFTVQGATGEKSKAGEMGMRVFNLIDQSQLFYEDSKAKFALSKEAAIHGSPILMDNAKTLVYTAENGLLYKIALDTKLDKAQKTITVTPDVQAYKYQVAKKKNLGIEGSVAVYNQYAYFADAAGTLQCVDLGDMRCVWAVNVKDSTPSTVALEETPDGKVALYTGTTIKSKDSLVCIRRFDALTGELVWEQTLKTVYNRDLERNGVMASPIVGQGNISDLVLFTINGYDEDGAAVLALNKETGETEWEQYLGAQAWSSPLAIYTPENIAYIVQGDERGLHLYDGFAGSPLFTLPLNGVVLGSPAAYKDMIVVGTSEPKIYGIRIH
jgi:outer membrane protein assembly factor BamB/cell division septation protein DedD